MAAALDAGLLQHLERLDKEVDVLNGKLDQARQAWSQSRDDLEKQVYDDVKAEVMPRLVRLDQLRQDLQSQLTGVWGAVNGGAEYCASTCNRCA
jgi:hypothetical protein